jgi:DNA-binding CsgD family transcriptional regulator
MPLQAAMRTPLGRAVVSSASDPARERISQSASTRTSVRRIESESRLRRELVAAGARPRRPAVTGIESLTPAETLVANFAAQGMSNREIADQSFITRNTAAWHLRNVYRKLRSNREDNWLLSAS